MLIQRQSSTSLFEPELVQMSQMPTQLTDFPDLCIIALKKVLLKSGII